MNNLNSLEVIPETGIQVYARLTPSLRVHG